MTNRAQALVLHRMIHRPTVATLHSCEIELSLSDDGRYVTLSRYVERYGDPETDWSGVRHHRVLVPRLIRWMIKCGILEMHSRTDPPETIKMVTCRRLKTALPDAVELDIQLNMPSREGLK